VSNPSSPSPSEGPRLPGIVPIGSDPQKSIEPVNPLVRLAVQFFVIPMAIVIVCVALAFVFRWLTFEKKDTSTYLATLSSATRSSSQKEQDAMKLLQYVQDAKEWQGIYDVTQQLRFNREAFLKENPDFPLKVAQIFQKSAGADRKVRQYLAQVLGLIGGSEVVNVLLSALEDSDSETVIHSMIALGQIGDPKAITPLIQLSKSDDRGVRQTAVFVLGNFDDLEARRRCTEALNDPDLLVTWNAAFGLARRSDPVALPVLERFLDADYIDNVTKAYAPTSNGGTGASSSTPLATFHPDRLEQYRAVGVRLLGQYSDLAVRQKLEKTAINDRQLKIRQAAIEAMKSQTTDQRPERNKS
jgi:hypothetical protein